MADVADAIAGFLAGQTSISSIAGNRIYPDKLKQGVTEPAIVFWKVATTHAQTIHGLAGAAECRIEFECSATTRKASRDLAEAIKNELMPGDGTYPIRGEIGGVTFLDVSLDQGQRYYFYPMDDGSDESIYVTTQDFVFNYIE